MELIESAIEGEHKILLFSQFTTMLELLEQDLKKAGISDFTESRWYRVKPYRGRYCNSL